MTHSDEKPYECINCAKSFKTLALLKSHERIYQPKEKCDTCGKKVRALAEHLKTHNNEKKYACKFCDKASIKNRK